MIGTQLQNKHNGRRVIITEKVVTDTGNIIYSTECGTYLHFVDMHHNFYSNWFEVSTVRINRKPKYMGEEE